MKPKSMPHGILMQFLAAINLRGLEKPGFGQSDMSGKNEEQHARCAKQ